MQIGTDIPQHLYSCRTARQQARRHLSQSELRCSVMRCKPVRGNMFEGHLGDTDLSSLDVGQIQKAVNDCEVACSKSCCLLHRGQLR